MEEYDDSKTLGENVLNTNAEKEGRESFYEMTGRSPSESDSDKGPGRTYYIKGNINVSTGEKIYHMPGDEYYDSTVIDESKGERWFSSEEEAQAAGWRHAYV